MPDVSPPLSAPPRAPPPVTPPATPLPATVQLAPAAVAGMGRRLAAMGYDGLLILGIVLLVLFPMVMVLNNRVPQPVVWALVMLITVLFHCYFWVRHGRTLGMQAWRFEVRNDATGGRITITQALLRFMVLMPALLFIEAGSLYRPALIAGLVYVQANYLWMWFNPARRTWSDLISGSRMLRTAASGGTREQPPG